MNRIDESVDFDETNEQLCIYGGTMGAENARVDVWNGSGWENIFSSLNSGWNNGSVSSYLNSSTFTIRFKRSIETGDAAQDTWNIDAVLLYTWTLKSRPHRLMGNSQKGNSCARISYFRKLDKSSEI